jgi:hypothetical protein
MYVIIAPIQLKQGYKEQFIESVTEDARSSVRDEPGCLRFDAIQDANDAPAAGGSTKSTRMRRRSRPIRKRHTSLSFEMLPKTGAQKGRRGQAEELLTSGHRITNGNNYTREPPL